MTARDINNKTIKESNWIKSNDIIFQIHKIYKNGDLECWFIYNDVNSKVFRVDIPIIIYPFNCELVNDPIAYNVTDHE